MWDESTGVMAGGQIFIPTQSMGTRGKIALIIIAMSVSLFGCKEKTTAKAQTDTPNALAQHILGEMVKIPGGTFTMGTNNPKYSDFYGSNQHEHSVTVSDFYMQKYLVTIEQMNIFKTIHHQKIDDLPSTGPNLWSYRSPENVNYPSAANFCAWLAQKTGLPFKLPTEAQWMYMGTDKGTMIVATNNGKWEACKNAPCFKPKGPDIVGQYPPNPLGIDVMMLEHQWTQDWYGDGYYWNSPKNNPQGLKSGTKKTLVGGDYVFYRMGGDLPSSDDHIGEIATFRCVINTAGAIYPNKLMKPTFRIPTNPFQNISFHTYFPVNAAIIDDVNLDLVSLLEVD